tara:strand:+ start:272 stop:949 length:678 start_codon:yes stop_codon:yes gene_type:complete
MNPIKHVAIIMDGNGRWGIKNKNSRNLGHKAGLETIQVIINETIKYQIKYLTLYTFSTENWKRPKKEINYLFKLLENFLKKKINLINDKDIKLNIIGNKKIFSKKLKKIFDKSEILTSKNKVLHINLAINYGSKNEILRASKIVKSKKQAFTEKNIEKNLFTKNMPNPDVLIRTGNTNRISNFLLWQIAYTEIFFEKMLWPDFNANHYKKILNKFKKIKRNYGSI